MFSNLLKKWKKKGYLNNSEAKDSEVSECILARAYGLLKANNITDDIIPDDALPFRLSISCIDSFKYFFSQLYEEILSNSIKKPPQSIKNSYDFIKKSKVSKFLKITL